MTANAIASRTASTGIPTINPVFEPLDEACGVGLAELLDAAFEEVEEAPEADDVEIKCELD